jgi:hypothetical protein
MPVASSPSEAELPLGAASATSSATLTLLTPRQRVAKLLEAVGLGHHEPEAIAELHLRDRFGGRPPKPDQLADVRRFEDLMWLAYGIEMHGLDIPVYSPHRPIFNVLTIEQIEELLLLHATIRRFIREAKCRVSAIAEQPTKYLWKPGGAPGSPPIANRSQGHDRRPGCNARTRGSRRGGGARAGPSSDDPHESDPDDLDRRAAWGRR